MDEYVCLIYYSDKKDPHLSKQACTICEDKGQAISKLNEMLTNELHDGWYFKPDDIIDDREYDFDIYSDETYDEYCQILYVDALNRMHTMCTQSKFECHTKWYYILGLICPVNSSNNRFVTDKYLINEV